jgi:hypothetical protein
MPLLIIDPTYPEREDECQSVRDELTQSLSQKIGYSAVLEDVDAGPSASIPAYWLEIAGFVWTVFAAPKTIQDNWSYWIDCLKKSFNVLDKVGATYSIDFQMAYAFICKSMAEKNIDMSVELELVSCIRHSINLNGPSIQILHPTPDIAKIDSDIDRHFEATRQYSCVYIILVKHDTTTYTAVVSSRGDVKFLEEISWT